MSFIPHQDVAALSGAQPLAVGNQLDEEDSWVVENHHLHDWDPVSITVGH